MNLEWSKKWFGGFSKAGLEDMLSMYADRFEFHDIPLDHKAGNRDELRAFFGGFIDAPGENTFKPTAYAGDANGGAVEWTWYAKHEGDVMGVPAAGKQTEVKGVSIVRFQGGKIVSQHDYWDVTTLMRQLGAAK